jgi:4,5-DOPA dioxygenase extradiol
MNKKMPIVFVGHGSPMNAIEDNEFSNAWGKIGELIPQPTSIVVISAHWQSDGTKATGSEKPKQIYDFYGFPEELYQKIYEINGNVELAKRIADLDSSWGIDHGAWSVLCRMYPKADIPVIQLSLDVNKSTKQHWETAIKLAKLREENVLILGSGNVVHNLGIMEMRNDGFDWANEFDENIKNLIIKEDWEKLINYESLKNSELAIPTNEHYLPMLYILAMKEKSDEIKFMTEKITMGSISMRSMIVG